MTLDKDLISEIKKVAEKCGGYLTVQLYDDNRDKLPSWETIKNRYQVGFSEFLRIAKIKSKEEYNLERNRVKAISNFKLLSLEHGYVSRKLYDEANFTPSSDYISDHYGWMEIAKEANVKLSQGQYTGLNEMIEELKQSIKKLGYVPSSSEYKKLLLKPSQDALASQGITWTEAMRKAGYKPYGKTVTVKDKVCSNDDCFRQFTPETEDDVYCVQCYKEARAKLSKSFKSLNRAKLEEACQKLLFNGNSQKNIIDLINTIN